MGGVSHAELVSELVGRAKSASDRVAELPTDVKDAALRLAADHLEAATERLVAENARDLSAGRANGLADAMLDRLALDPGRIAGVAQGLRDVAALPDPVG
jgi:glutamate-5-semialdehyde dehydrogenase